MRTITVSRNEHGLLQFAFDAETARLTTVAAFTMDRSAAEKMAECILSGDFGEVGFVGIVYDGGEIVINMGAGALAGD
jgi:hypothetical protein